MLWPFYYLADYNIIYETLLGLIELLILILLLAVLFKENDSYDEVLFVNVILAELIDDSWSVGITLD